MRHFSFFGTLVLTLVFSTLHAQDFSNKGKDFWVAYGYHQTMGGAGGGPQNMVLYFATEQATVVQVNIPGTGYSQTYSIPANTIFTSNPLPKTGANDARLTTGGVSNKGIHITSDKPIVAYAHIYNQSVSGATLLFPTNTLGREYYSINYEQVSNSANANCWFYAVAVDPGITTVRITPSRNTTTHPGGTPFTVNLTQGQVINMMGEINSTSTGGVFRGVDLTGSKIESISSGGDGCKRLAVFSGSGRISLSCDGSAPSSDNYMVQAFPKNAWGKNYLTAPTRHFERNFFRIAVDDPTTVVSVNGAVIGGLIDNFYYQLGPSAAPNKIVADKPITVAQYTSSATACNNTTSFNNGDPEVIYLSPIEQTINRVILNSTSNFNIDPNYHFINVIIPNGGTAISSLRLDGVAPVGTFTVHPQNTQYSYAQLNVSPGQHILQSDSGFSAIAYGYGNFESYGYNAGTNVKDLYQFVTVTNEFSTVDFPAACKAAPFSMAMTFPYEPTQIIWQFNGLFTDVTDNSPVATSTSVVNGKTLYKYVLPGSYTVPTAGTYPIKIIAQNPTADGCNGEQEIDFDLQVYDPPVADFNFATNGCVSGPVAFTDNSTNTSGRPITHWHYDFGDNNTIDDVANTSHTYTAPGSYEVKYTMISDVGCKSDTARRTVVLNDPPVANFSPVAPFCAGNTVSFQDNSSVATGAIAKWIWNFGEGPIETHLTGGVRTHTYTNPGTYTVTLQVETASGCISTVFSYPNLVINPNPVVNFTLPNVCLPDGVAAFTSNSTISDGTESQFTYEWNFGDGSPLSTAQNPVHNYTTAGPFNVTLAVTSNNNCRVSATQNLTTIYPEPKAIFTAPSEVCLGAPVNFNESSQAQSSTVTGWSWDFGDNTTSTERNPVKTYAAAGTYTVTLTVTSAIGCESVSPANIATQTITVNPLPIADFITSLPACEGKGVTFTDNSIPLAGAIVKWTWNYGVGGDVVRTTNPPYTHTYATVGTYNASLQVETDKGCISTRVPSVITVNEVPDAGFIVPIICVNDVFAPFEDTSDIGTGSLTAWEWNFGDPNATPGNPNISNQQDATHHFTQPGDYQVQLVSTSNTGCKDTVVRTVTVNGGGLVPRFTLENTGTLCSNTEITIRDASTIDAGRILRLEIFWDQNDLTNKTVDDAPASGKTYSHTYPEFGTPATRSYTIRYEIWSGITCVNSYTETITLNANPQLSFASVVPVCSNVPAFQLTQVQLQNGLPGTGTFSGTGISSTGLFDPAEAGSGTHSILYSFEADNGCSNSVSQDVIVNPTPIADAGPDRALLEGGTVVLNPVLITDIPVTYLWTPSTWLDDPTIANAEASPPTDFSYTLTVTSDQGCETRDEVFVKLLKSVVIPNIFSPNGDGIHDRWVIEHLESYPGCVVQIFNRYGQMVQKFVNYTTPWDGKINGKDAPVGTYYYIIDPKNGRKPLTGFIDIIR